MRVNLTAELDDLTIAFEDREYRFRAPAFEDVYSALKGMPILPGDGEAKSEPKMIETLRYADALMQACGVEPRFSVEKTDEPGVVWARSIHWQARVVVLNELLKAAGFSLAEAQRIRPTSETAEGSSSSTVSDSGTDAVRATSSTEVPA